MQIDVILTSIIKYLLFLFYHVVLADNTNSFVFVFVSALMFIVFIFTLYCVNSKYNMIVQVPGITQHQVVHRCES